MSKSTASPAGRPATPGAPKVPDCSPVLVRDTPIELCQFLKFAGLADSGGQAKQAIAEGLVLLNGVTETRKRRKLGIGDRVTFAGRTIVVAT